MFFDKDWKISINWHGEMEGEEEENVQAEEIARAAPWWH